MRDNKKNIWMLSIGIFLIIVSIISITIFLLKGQTTITGQNGSVISSESLVCESENQNYQFLSYDHAIRKTAKISALFNNNELSSISLLYALYYSDSELIETSRTINSAQLNVFYSKDGLPANSFSKSVSSSNATVIISLYADKANFNNKTSKYFMADNLGEKSSPEDFEKLYTEKGFTCRDNNNSTKETDEK